MTEQPKHKSVEAAKLAVMRDIAFVAKVPNDDNSYTYASEAGLIDALREPLIRHGLTMTPRRTELLQSFGYRTSEGPMRHVRIRVTYRLSHPDSGTHEDIQILGEAADRGDKAIAKAQTLAMKYALRQPFLIKTGDDPDKHAAIPETVASYTQRTTKLDAVGSWPCVTGEAWEAHRIESENSTRKNRMVGELYHNDQKWFERATTIPAARDILTPADLKAIDEAKVYYEKKSASVSN